MGKRPKHCALTSLIWWWNFSFHITWQRHHQYGMMKPSVNRVFKTDVSTGYLQYNNATKYVYIWTVTSWLPWLFRETHLVKSDNHSPSQANVVLQGHFCPWDLPPASLPPQLPAQLCTLGQTCERKKMDRGRGQMNEEWEQQELLMIRKIDFK